MPVEFYNIIYIFSRKPQNFQVSSTFFYHNACKLDGTLTIKIFYHKILHKILRIESESFNLATEGSQRPIANRDPLCVGVLIVKQDKENLGQTGLSDNTKVAFGAFQGSWLSVFFLTGRKSAVLKLKNHKNEH